MLNTNYGITNRWRERLARWDWWVGALVCFSIALRWLMVWNGGQFWFPDEVRFWWSGQVVHSLHLSHWKLALEPILELNQHPGFTCLACVPVAIHWMWKYWMGFSYRAMPYEETARFAAAMFSLASVSSMLLVREIIRRAGGSRGEARLAMGLMAASAAMLYYVRHVVPYDLAMALALAGLAVGMKGAGWRRLLFSGWLTGAAFVTYYGYWAIVAVVTVAVVTWKIDSIKSASRRLVWFGMGALTWITLFTFGAAVMFRQSFLKTMVSFAETVDLGEFAEGWSLPWAYLWHAEHVLLIFWLVAAGWILWAAATRRQPAGYGLAWVAMAVGIYLLFILSSDVLRKFVVYGRTARQLVPFLCLAGAFAGTRLLEAMRPVVRKRLWSLAIMALVIQAAWNFRTPLNLWFPDDVKRLVVDKYGAFSEAVTVNDPVFAAKHENDGSPSQASRYVLVNCQYLARFDEVKPIPAGAVVLRLPHPEQFKPNQYEEFTPRQRDILRHTDISIRVIDTGVEPGLAKPPTIP